MTQCLIELPDDLFTQMRQLATEEQKTISQYLTEILRQQLRVLPPLSPADPDMMKFFGSWPDFPPRAPQGEYEQRETWE
jgi:hypothetical protein